jgi:Ca2+-binding RTX toxin-like protein
MKGFSSTRRWLLALTAAAAIAVGFGLAADRASAAYNAKVSQNVLSVGGDAASDKLVLRLKAGSPSILQVDVGENGTADFSFDRATFDTIVVHTGGGDDAVRIGEGNGGFTDTEKTTLLGEGGSDTLIGGSFAETLRGGDGADTIDGNAGDDTAFGNAANDTFVWNPGDGSDLLGGDDGVDSLRFNGSNEGEKIDLFSVAGRLRVVRDLSGSIDAGGVETVNVRALGGPDKLTVNNGVFVPDVRFDLAAQGGGGDGQIDNVVLNGTSLADNIQVGASSGTINVTGLPASVVVTKSEKANDQLLVNGNADNDSITARPGLAALTSLTVDGGAHNDVIAGGDGADFLRGNDGDDRIDGNQGNDVVFLGTGNDITVWEAGDGNDTIEGQDGTDLLIFDGSNVSERFDLSANGSRLGLFRDVGNDVIDAAGIEHVTVVPLGGPDAMIVGDLTGTDVTNVRFNLAGAFGGPDQGQIDEVTVNGTAGADLVLVGGLSTKVTGLAASVEIGNSEQADKLTVNALAGDDVIDSTPATGAIALSLIGGLGNDRFFGGGGSETIVGNDGDDLAFMGGGDDTFVWNPGDDNDTLEGQEGTDAMRFHAANVSESIYLAANGSRLRLFRNVANVVLDAGDVEVVDARMLGGADTFTVNDLSGTDVADVNVDLGAAGGGGDLQPDNVVVNGTFGPDTVLVLGDSTGVAALGLASEVDLTNAEAANDTLTVNGLAGDDAVQASGLTLDAIKLVGNGEDGDDALTGGYGGDVLRGGAGDDLLIGGPGADAFDCGPGNDAVIRDTTDLTGCF